MMKRTRLSTQQVSGVGRLARRARLVLPVLGLLLIGLASSAVAQDATFTGKVFDPKGKPVEGATVTLTKADDPNVKASAVTDKKGEYKLTMGTVGDYKLRAEKQGFGPGERPAKVELGMLYADAHLQLGDEAAFQQNQAVEAFNAGVKDLQAGKPEAAIENFKKASELNPKLPQPVYAMAAAYHGLKKWPEAAAALDKYQQMAPTDVRPELYQLAFETYFEAGQDDKAKAALAKITDPKAKAELAPRVYNSGVAKNKEKDIEGSVERFKLAAELDPTFDQAYQNVAAIEFNKQNYKEALAYLDKLLKVKPDSVEGLRMRYFALRALDDERMKSAMQAYVTKVPNAGEEIAKIAGEDFDNGNTAAATKTLEALIEVKPDIAIAHYHLGRALASAGANASAKTHLQHFIEMAPSHPDAAAAKQMMAAL
jgi:tetratricopeptide (TPR) repeat protein